MRRIIFLSYCNPFLGTREGDSCLGSRAGARDKRYLLAEAALPLPKRKSTPSVLSFHIIVDIYG